MSSAENRRKLLEQSAVVVEDLICRIDSDQKPGKEFIARLEAIRDALRIETRTNCGETLLILDEPDIPRPFLHESIRLLTNRVEELERWRDGHGAPCTHEGHEKPAI